MIESCVSPLLPVSFDASVHVLQGPISPCCGAFAWRLFAECLGLEHATDLFRVHAALLRMLQGQVLVSLHSPVGFGPGGQLLKNLINELSKHGIPESLVEDRAQAALKCLGHESVSTALTHRQPWKQLKTLGNQHRFQFVLPSELASEIAKNKGKPVAPKGKGKGGSKPPQQTVELDPSKLLVLDGTFQAGAAKCLSCYLLRLVQSPVVS